MRVTIYEDKAGEFRWRLSATNGKRIADSGEGYKTRRGAEGAVRRLLEAVSNSAALELACRRALGEETPEATDGQ